MKRLFVLASLALAIPSIALACGDKKCDKAACGLPAAEQAALPADGTHASLVVTGMSCGACATKIHAALMGVKGVKGATVDQATGAVEVAFDAKATTTDSMLAAVNGLGHFSAKLK
jgi:copper chaperone CopZ